VFTKTHAGSYQPSILILMIYQHLKNTHTNIYLDLFPAGRKVSEQVDMQPTLVLINSPRNYLDILEIAVADDIITVVSTRKTSRLHQFSVNTVSSLTSWFRLRFCRVKPMPKGLAFSLLATRRRLIWLYRSLCFMC